MDDVCSRGSIWNLADQLVAVDADQPDDDLVGPLNWMRFRGRWGNIKKVVNCSLVAAGLLPGACIIKFFGEIHRKIYLIELLNIL